MEFVKNIEKLEDMQGIKADEFVVVHTTVETSDEKVKLANIGFVYNIGEGRFSLIEQVYSGSVFPISPSLGRVSYDWSPINQTFVSNPSEVDFPFEQNTPEYKKFESLLKGIQGAVC